MHPRFLKGAVGGDGENSFPQSNLCGCRGTGGGPPSLIHVNNLAYGSNADDWPTAVLMVLDGSGGRCPDFLHPRWDAPRKLGSSHANCLSLLLLASAIQPLGAFNDDKLRDCRSRRLGGAT